MDKRVFSVDAPECIACKHYKDCKNKRMAMCAYIEPAMTANVAEMYQAATVNDIVVKHDFRDVKIGNMTVSIDLEQVKKEINKVFECNFLQGGA